MNIQQIGTRLSSGTIFLILWVLLTSNAFYVADRNAPWAEDGTHLFFLSLSNLSFFEQILTPVVNIPTIVARVISYILIQIDPIQAPQLAAYVSTFIMAGVGSYILKDSFSWLIPSYWTRALIAAFIVLGPGSIELGGTLIGTGYTLGIFTFLIALEKPLLPPKIIVPLWLLLSSSNAISFIAVPLLLTRYITSRRTIFAALASISTAIIVVMYIFSHTTATKIYKVEWIAVSKLISNMTDAIWGYFLLFPFSLIFAHDWPLVIDIEKNFLTFIALTCISASYFFLHFKGISREKQLLIGSMILAPALYSAAHAMGRFYHQSILEMGNIQTHTRLTLAPTFPTILAWFIIFSNKQGWKGAYILNKMLILSVTLLVFSNICISTGSNFTFELYRIHDWKNLIVWIKSPTKQDLLYKSWSAYIGPLGYDGKINCTRYQEKIDCTSETYSHEKQEPVEFGKITIGPAS